MSVFKIGELNAVLIHIPKTGGTSLRKGVFSDVDGPYYGPVPSKFLDLFKFAFVREPITRFLSCVSMFKYGTVDKNGAIRRRGSDTFNVDAAIEILKTPGLNYGQNRRSFSEKFLHHALPMSHPFNSIVDADCIYRFESFEQDYIQICKRCDIQPIPALPKLHISRQQISPQSLTDQQILFLLKYYEQDYADFDYNKKLYW